MKVGIIEIIAFYVPSHYSIGKHSLVSLFVRSFLKNNSLGSKLTSVVWIHLPLKTLDIVNICCVSRRECNSCRKQIISSLLKVFSRLYNPTMYFPVKVMFYFGFLTSKLLILWFRIYSFLPLNNEMLVKGDFMTTNMNLPGQLGSLHGKKKVMRLRGRQAKLESQALREPRWICLRHLPPKPKSACLTALCFSFYFWH